MHAVVVSDAWIEYYTANSVTSSVKCSDFNYTVVDSTVCYGDYTDR